MDQQIEKELSIDEEQLGRIFNEKGAKEYAENRRGHSYFCEASLLSSINKSHYEHDSIACLYGDMRLKEKEVIKKIFTDPRVKGITQDAIDLMLPYWELFTSGMNLDNLPIGLAFDAKRGVVFASEERLIAMQVTDATINLNYVLPNVSDPLMYSWLPFATKGVLTFDDIYGSSHAPKMKDCDHHPSSNYDHWSKTSKSECGDPFLDIPYNQVYKSSYQLEEKTYGIVPDYKYFFSPLLTKAESHEEKACRYAR